jgi:two-component system nitrogen regulation response regulator NtrX
MAPNTKHKVLFVDDDPPVLAMLKELFTGEYEAIAVASGNEAVEAAREHPDLAAVVMDIKMAGMDGITAARHIRDLNTDVPIIFHTGHPGEYNEREIDDTEQPFDYIQKGKSIPKLVRSVRNAVDAYNLKLNNRNLTDIAENSYGMYGRSAAMQEVFRAIHKIGPGDTKVMILGESGTGKELVARAIHNSSRRKHNQLAILNCNHKSPHIIEAELFGNVKGAFTDASVDRVGLFEYADGGTLFLDEIGDLDITTQAKLLRVIETGEYVKLGTPETRHSDVRVLCATHRHLLQLVSEGKFREDLYFRLKGVIIPLPPLRERKEDIPILVERFAAKFTAEEGLSPKIFDKSAIQAFVDYDWPGNVRDLQDRVESLISLSDSDIIFGEEVRADLEQTSGDPAEGDQCLRARMKAHERTLIIEALIECGFNITAAAKLLAIDRTNLQKKIKTHDIDMDSLRG